MSKTSHHPSFSLLSFNTLGTPFFAPSITDRYKKMAEFIETSGIDVVCLQEVTTYYHVHLLKKFLKSYPYQVYKKFFLGPKGGLVIFSKLPLESVRYDGFSELGSLTTYTRYLRNGVLSCRLKNFPIRIMNTHLISDFEYKSSLKNPYYIYLKKQVQEASILMSRFAKTEDSVVMVGDFNLTYEDPAYKDLISSTKAKDLFAKDTSPTYFGDRYNWKYNTEGSVRIDYIFLLDKYDRISVESLDHAFTDKVQITPKTRNYLSDHIGLLAKFVSKS
jgi:endonuclease/exonuclease/phosphatase family metal-dependent hydrolase